MKAALELEVVAAALGLGMLYLFAALSAVHAVMRGRTPQGSLAWSIALLSLPLISLPLYWTVGRSKLGGYIDARREAEASIAPITDGVDRLALKLDVDLIDPAGRLRAVQRLARTPFTRGNDVRLLIDGEATMEAILRGIEEAERYVLAQFFIIRDDEIGNRFKAALIAKASAGVRTFLLFDELGCSRLSRRYRAELAEAGVDIRAFGTRRRRINRLGLNFRNHRKIVVADGRRAWIGGHNIGDEYLGRDARFGSWRDTHVEVEGPAVLGVQRAWAEDWYWASGLVPDLDWSPRGPAAADRTVLALATGPADRLETCGLAFVEAIHAASRRAWIASPYFVPDQAVVAALQLAALRGVDVRILLPEKVDHLSVHLAGYSYYPETIPHGVRIFRYEPGFLHQKVMLVDDTVACIGTANLDQRSFRLNFEIGLVVLGHEFAGSVENMLVSDFAGSREAALSDFTARSWPFRLASRVTRLAAPLL